MERDTPLPRWIWAIPVGIAALRALPWLASHWIEPGPDQTLLHVGFIPKDTLQYLAFAREASTGPSLFVANPFTTEPQMDRFLLPLFAVIGWLASITGLPTIAWLELSRLPLLLVFFALLWRLLGLFFPDPRERGLTCLLIGLAGGIEVLAKPLAGALPSASWAEFEQATWQMSGWSLFAASANPLWIAGGAGVLLLLRPMLDTRAPASPWLAVGFFALFLLHPYSAVAVAAIALAQPVVTGAAGAEVDMRRWLRIGLLLALAGAAIAAFAMWQRADAVYAETATGVLGSQQLSPFWYPLVLGGLLVLGLRGARSWAAGEHPLRFALLAWLFAAVFLHTSTLFNGYHFAAQLHVPLCILAAPAFFDAWKRAARGKPGAVVLCGVTLAAPLLLTVESIALLPTTHAVPAEFPRLVEQLADKPSGNVLAGARLGNVLPAYTDHRVYVGHHFLTPHYSERRRTVIDWTRDPDRGDALRKLVEEQQIRYAALPTQTSGPGLAALTPIARTRTVVGRYTLLELD